jgi:hypothetical protein
MKSNILLILINEMIKILSIYYLYLRFVYIYERNILFIYYKPLQSKKKLTILL